MVGWGCVLAKDHVDHSPIIILKLIFDTLIRGAYFVISFKDFLKNSGVKKESGVKSYRLDLSLRWLTLSEPGL